MTASVDGLIRQLEAIDEDLSQMAIEKLREALEGDQTAVAEEKKISRARRSVEKAAGILAGMPEPN